MHRFARYVLSSLALLASLPARAETISVATTGISVSVEADGRYRVDLRAPAWSFTGTVDRGVSSIRQAAGTDGAGPYVELLFTEAGGAGRQMAIRTWASRPGVLFRQTLPSDGPAPSPFPSLVPSPALPHHLSFAGKWSVPRFDSPGPEGPWALFDEAGRTVVVSPAANFMVATLERGADGRIDSRFDARIQSLPKGHEHATLLAFGPGVNAAFDAWGALLTDLTGKVRPTADADATLRSLGYWTDNGAAYYYSFDGKCGYEGTLLNIRDEFQRLGLPLGYLQLDSWWYPKGNTGEWNPKPDQWVFGIGTYDAHPAIFPDGLGAFQDRLGLPLVTHARWIDEKSPYRKQYRISGNVAVDPAYWDAVAGYLGRSGVKTYEQDWLDSKASAAFNLDDQNAFLDQMARSMAANGITMQYCMPTPRHILQGSKYSNLTSARVSEDRFGRDNWAQAVYSSRLLSAVGIWPWVDVFKSCEEADVLLATLSAGVVGGSDALGVSNALNLGRAARRDGLLVKPDSPLVPADSTFLAEARNGPSPVVAFTRTDHEGSRALYLFAFRRGDAKAASFTPAEAGMKGELFAWDVRRQTGRLVAASNPMPIDLADDWSYQVLVPVGASGIAFVGDEGKFVPRGKVRVPACVDGPSGTSAEISFAAGEDAVTLLGFSSAAPEVEASSGTVLSVAWNRRTGVFRAVVAPGPGGSAAVAMKRAGRKAPEADVLRVAERLPRP